MRFTRWIVKFLIIGAFLFVLGYANRDRIPAATELTTLDFIRSGGIDINGGEFSLSYISSEDKGEDIFNVKSHTLGSAIEQLQGLTNKTVKDTHLDYILIGEDTARENLSYFIRHYAQRPSVRLDVNVFITKDMTSEEFIEKAMTSDIDVNARVDSLLKDRTQLSSFAKRNLKNLLQIYYSEEQTGLLPVLEIVESPVKSTGDNNGGDEDDGGGPFEEDDEEDENGKNEDDDNNDGYTFAFYGLGIIKDGKLTGFLEHELVRTYIILTKNLTVGAIEITDENDKLSTFSVKGTQNKISFEFCDSCESNENGNENGRPTAVNFDVSIDVNFDETFAREQILTDENIPVLNDLKNEVIKSEIERVIAKSRETGADFLKIREAFALRHPHKYHFIRDDWSGIFTDLEYNIRVSTTVKRYFNMR